ncbi:unnamed protein product [Cladocopium goreaui]|uniref:Uncharacterized protein n=1 Tax=Cladocopium goreaui TaxID=2562237 RepID=A0A9P1G9M6_9DINO|nr:unnamed protein product [Cladocopium goreaui]
MEVQALLESSQWKASALSTLWRPLEQDAGSELHAARAGSVAQTEESWTISACEKRAPEEASTKETPSASSVLATAQAEMVKEIREAYTDEKDMPASVRRMVEKHDPNSGRQLTASMNKTTKDLEKARDSLQRLSDAKAKHRSKWMNHMKSLMETLSKQVEAFEDQQRSYNDKIKTAQKDITITRRELRRLTAQAAADHSAEVVEPTLDEEDQTDSAVDVEEDELRTQVYDLLSKCLKKADKATVVEINSDEEHMDTSAERANKRPLTIGNGGDCLRKDHREPAYFTAKDAGNFVEAYDYQQDGCAASRDCSYTPWPLHPRAYNDDVCVYPFMAIHNAHVLAHQCGSLDDEPVQHADEDSWISCFAPLPAWDFLTWSQTLTEAWQGILRPQQAVSFFVVEPEPPIAEWENHHAQLILVQAPQHFERAVLFSSVYHAHQQVAFQRIARFFLSELHLQECIDNAEVSRQVRHRPIQAFYGWRPILSPPQPRTAVVDGAAVVLHVRQAPETLGQFERYPFDFLWQEDEYVPQHTSHRTRSRSPRRQDSASDDDVSFLAHQPIQTRPAPALADLPEVAREAHMLTEDEDEETDSSASASTYDSDEHRVRHVIGLARHEIQYIYMVNYRPADLYAAGTYVALVLRANDLDTGDTRRMVLVDIVFHEHNAADTTTHRYATLVRKDMTRRLLLEDLKLQAYCKQVKQQCIVRINGKLLPLSNHLLFDMHHADYIRIDLPPHAKRSLSSKAIARCLRDGLSMAEAQRLFDQAIRDPASATAFCQQLHNPIWNLDPHQSADHLARNAYHALQQITPKIHRWRRKHHVDESTWALVEEKKMLCRQFKALRKARSNTILQVMFSAWRSQTQDVPHHLYTAPATWMKMIDHAIATTTTQMQTAAKRASEAIRKADTQYYLSLAEHAGHAYTHEGLTAVWKQIKAVLPRNKLKQTQARHEMSDSLLHHFAELEAGTISNQAKSRQSCIDRNNKDLAAGPPSRQLMLEDLPTLVEIEDLYAASPPKRSPPTSTTSSSNPSYGA